MSLHQFLQRGHPRASCCEHVPHPTNPRPRPPQHLGLLLPGRPLRCASAEERVEEDRLLDERLVRHVFSFFGVAMLVRRQVLHGRYALQCLEGLPHFSRYLCVPELQHRVHAEGGLATQH